MLPKKQAQKRRQTLEVDHSSRQICLDRDIVQPAAHRSTQAVLSLSFAMHPLGPPAVSLIRSDKFIVRLKMPPSCSQMCFVAVAYQNRPRCRCLVHAVLSKSAPATIRGPGTIDPSLAVLRSPGKDLASRALNNIVPGVIFETPQR